jgi:hypothetical protein
MQLTLKENVHVKTTEMKEDVIHRVLTNSEELVVERREGPDGPWKRDSGADRCVSADVKMTLAPK